jgi:uncharacterized protein YjeT (DUF2065 family)
MQFNVMYDAAQQGYPAWHMNGMSLVLVCVGLLLVLAPDLMQRLLPRGLQGRARRIFSWFFLCAALVGTFVTFWSTTQPYDAAAAALRDHRYSVVEGPVTAFVPMPYSGHAQESFVVGGRKFSYSDYILTGCFNNAASHGGPIRPGVVVRISYTGNCIVRVEVAQ